VIVVDSSAVVATFKGEADAPELSQALALADRRVMSAATYVECVLVLSSRAAGRTDLDEWIARRGVDVVPVDHAMAQVAADAFVRFGKGRHPAGLNFGDCFAYALAKSLDAPLLFKGNDFSKTDIASALP
jgi:ribonuclease VapC